MAKEVKRIVGTWRFVLPADRELPEAAQTTFVLRPLSELERADIHDNMVRRHVEKDGGTRVSERGHRLSIEVCASHVHAIENFPVGKPEAWPDDVDARFAYLNRFDDADVQAVGNEIWRKSEIGADVKNSSPPEPTSRSGGASAADSSTTAPSAERPPA